MSSAAGILPHKPISDVGAAKRLTRPFGRPTIFARAAAKDRQKTAQ